jgi:hypothetical protein
VAEWSKAAVLKLGDAAGDAGQVTATAGDTQNATLAVAGDNHAIARPKTIADDSVELALATALERASAAGEWATVAVLAKELEARRLAKANVVALNVERKRRS